MKNLIARSLLATAIAFGASGAALADDQSGCTSSTLHGRYVLTARGFTITADGAQPKAIVEVIDFDGDNGLSVPSATVSLNGVIVHATPGGGGTYTIDEACTGTFVFDGGPAWDFVTSPRGNELFSIQTNPGNVFQGTATRTLRARDADRK
jgi:hypothetical protein